MRTKEQRTPVVMEMTWQRGAVWMARSGYSDLELSAFMTVRRVASSRRSSPVPPALPASLPASSGTPAYSAAE